MPIRFRIDAAQARAVSIRAGIRIVRSAMREVQARARIEASHGPYTSGELASQIKTRGPDIVGPEVRGKVGVWTLAYAASVERGAGPHLIVPHGDYPLKFYWRKVGRVVHLAQVNHPGQRGKGYLRRPLREMALRRRMRVITYVR